MPLREETGVRRHGGLGMQEGPRLSTSRLQRRSLPGSPGSAPPAPPRPRPRAAPSSPRPPGLAGLAAHHPRARPELCRCCPWRDGKPQASARRSPRTALRRTPEAKPAAPAQRTCLGPGAARLESPRVPELQPLLLHIQTQSSPPARPAPLPPHRPGPAPSAPSHKGPRQPPPADSGCPSLNRPPPRLSAGPEPASGPAGPRPRAPVTGNMAAEAASPN